MAVTQVGILIEIDLFLGVGKFIIWVWGCQAYFDATYPYFVHVSAHCRGLGMARLGRAGNKRLEVMEIMFRGYVSLCREMIWPPRTRTPGNYSPVSGARPSTARQRPVNGPPTTLPAKSQRLVVSRSVNISSSKVRGNAPTERPSYAVNTTIGSPPTSALAALSPITPSGKARAESPVSPASTIKPISPADKRPSSLPSSTGKANWPLLIRSWQPLPNPLL